MRFGAVHIPVGMGLPAKQTVPMLHSHSKTGDVKPCVLKNHSNIVLSPSSSPNTRVSSLQKRLHIL